MKRSVSILALTAMVGSGLAMAGVAMAQQPANPAPARPSVPMPQYTAADATAVLNARIAALKTVIAMTPEQEKLWPPVEAAIRDIAKTSFERLKQRLAGPPTTDFLVALGKMANNEEARAKDIKTFIAAAKPLVELAQPGAEASRAGFLRHDRCPRRPAEWPALAVRGRRGLTLAPR